MDENGSKQDKNPLPSDWSDEENENIGSTAEAQLQATPRQPPPGWASWRKKGRLPITKKENSITQNDTGALVESGKASNGVQKLTMVEAQSITEEEFLAID